MSSSAVSDADAVLLSMLRDGRADHLACLAWADCLEESGADPARAEFARCQIASARGERAGRHRRAAKKLLKANAARWWPYPEWVRASWRMGFAWQVRCAPAAWVEYGAAVVRQHPVALLDLSMPWPPMRQGPIISHVSDGLYSPSDTWVAIGYWGGEDAHDPPERLPPRWASRLTARVTAYEALVDCQRAGLAWARECAGLLTWGEGGEEEGGGARPRAPSSGD